MLTLLAKRFGSMIVILVALIAVVFYLQKISPGDPAHTILGANASAAAVAHERHVLGLDRPVMTQFWHYLNGVLHGNLGVSYSTRHPVTHDLRLYLPATAELAGTALLIALFLATIFAFGSVLRWPGARLYRGALLLGASSPAFLLGIGGVVIFYEKLNWLPSGGRTSYLNAPTGPTGLLTVDSLLHGQLNIWWDAVEHLAMPATALALGPAVSIGRVLRSSLIADLSSDYARTARAKGLSELAILRKHVLRNAVGAALSMTGLQVGLMFAGVLVIENVFDWPGLGTYVGSAVTSNDFPAIAGVTLLLGAGYVIINAVVDVLQAVADPRIKV
jgi:peptide/nickel transport system permease protein